MFTLSQKSNEAVGSGNRLVPKSTAEWDLSTLETVSAAYLAYQPKRRCKMFDAIVPSAAGLCFSSDALPDASTPRDANTSLTALGPSVCRLLKTLLTTWRYMWRMLEKIFPASARPKTRRPNTGNK